LFRKVQPFFINNKKHELDQTWIQLDGGKMDTDYIEDIDTVILALDNGDLDGAKKLLEEMKENYSGINFNFFLN